MYIHRDAGQQAEIRDIFCLYHDCRVRYVEEARWRRETGAWGVGCVVSGARLVTKVVPN